MNDLTTRMPIKVLPAVSIMRCALTHPITMEDLSVIGGTASAPHHPVLSRHKLTFHERAAASISSSDYAE